MSKIILKNGLFSGMVTGLVLVLAMAYAYKTQNFEANMWLGFGSMVVAFYLVFAGIKKYRDTLNGGTVSLLDAFKIGLGITGVATVIYIIFWAIDYHFFVPDFMDIYTSQSIEKLKTEGLNTAELQQRISEIEKMKELYKSPLYFILFTALEIFPIGFLVTAVSAFVLKRS